MLNVITVGESLHLAGQPQRGRGTDPKWLFCRLPLKFFSGQMSVFRAPPSADPSRGWIKIVSYQNGKMDPERPPWENEPISAERKLQRLRTHIMQSAFFFFFLRRRQHWESNRWPLSNQLFSPQSAAVDWFIRRRPTPWISFEGFTDDDDWTVLDWCRVCDTIPASAELLLRWDILYGYELWPWVRCDGNTKAIRAHNVTRRL